MIHYLVRRIREMLSAGEHPKVGYIRLLLELLEREEKL